MKVSVRTLGEIFYSPSQYVIPVFQRNYRWDLPQWEKLWASVTDIQAPGKTGNHFMGFLVFVPGLAQPGQNNRFHLIDGQQRLTTCSLLLIALRDVARRLGQEDLATEVHDYLLVHPLKKGDQRLRLCPKEQDQVAYAALVEGGSAPVGRMAEARTWFAQALESAEDKAPGALRAVLDAVAQRLEFMCATLEAENAYNIFKSLNSTGVPLGQADLIRNFIFMHVPPDEQDAFDRERWAPLERMFTDATGRLDDEAFSRFFRDMLMSDGQYVAPKDTFAVFEARLEATGFSPLAQADAILASARHHAVISGKATASDPAITSTLRGLNLLESSTTYPLLLALFRRHAAGTLAAGALARAIEMLRGFILRRFVCGDSSRGYGQVFVRAIARLGDDPVAGLEAYLLDRGWPDDRHFIEAFVLFPLYKRGYAREVLETLERSRGHKEQADLQAAQIEHVMPQSLREEWIEALGEDAERLHADWLHRPGNLTLSAYNQELGNQAFGVKRQRFATSNIVLTRELADHAQWDAGSIRARGEALAREAAVIWVGPKEPHVAAEVQEVVPPASRQEVRMRFWTGLVAHLAQAHPELPAFEPRPARALRLPSGVRHVGFEVRHMLRPGEVAIDVYFWRAASEPLWWRFKDDPGAMDAMIGQAWTFERLAEEGRQLPRMSVSLEADSDDEAQWPALHRWLGQALARLYAHVTPALRAEMQDDEGAE